MFKYYLLELQYQGINNSLQSTVMANILPLQQCMLLLICETVAISILVIFLYICYILQSFQNGHF
jgi:hypothetical protein